MSPSLFTIVLHHGSGTPRRRQRATWRGLRAGRQVDRRRSCPRPASTRCRAVRRGARARRARGRGRAHALARRLGGEERLRRALPARPRHAGAVIAHRDAPARRRPMRRGDATPPAPAEASSAFLTSARRACADGARRNDQLRGSHRRAASTSTALASIRRATPGRPRSARRRSPPSSASPVLSPASAAICSEDLAAALDLLADQLARRRACSSSASAVASCALELLGDDRDRRQRRRRARAPPRPRASRATRAARARAVASRAPSQLGSRSASARVTRCTK